MVNAANLQLSNLQNGTYKLTVTDGAGCSGVVEKNLSFLPRPQIQNFSANNPCASGTLTLNAEITGGIGPYQLQWSGPNWSVNGSTSSQTGSVSRINPEAGVYSLVALGANGCPTAEATYAVSLLQNPVVSFTNNTPCENQNLNFNANVSNYDAEREPYIFN
jgi:hypothetical protein